MTVDGVRVDRVRATDPDVVALVEELTTELADEGYTPEETFGYTAQRLAASDVHLVGARDPGGALVGLGGLEIEDHDGAATGELKRFYVRPDRRGEGVADALLDVLVARARAGGAARLRLETGVHQHAAIGLYRRHGFVAIPRFGPYVDSATSYCMERAL